jgi:hypothetical protein
MPRDLDNFLLEEQSLNLGPHACATSGVLPEPCLQPFLLLLFCR